MVEIDVLLSGMLRIQGYGHGHPLRADGTVRVRMQQRCTVADVIQRLGIPVQRVVMAMLNGRQCRTTADLKQGDRVILIPEDVAMLWRALGRQNLDMGIGYDA
jgi:sulfur carrier protein ThiS